MSKLEMISNSCHCFDTQCKPRSHFDNMYYLVYRTHRHSSVFWNSVNHLHILDPTKKQNKKTEKQAMH